MPRPVLEESRLHPAIRDRVARHHAEIVEEVQRAVAEHPVVVVGMGINPFPRKARRLLDEARIAYRYLGYGSYLSGDATPILDYRDLSGTNARTLRTVPSRNPAAQSLAPFSLLAR